jgi:hypothetical protein
MTVCARVILSSIELISIAISLTESIF